MYQSVETRQFSVASAGIDPVVGNILSFLSLRNEWCYGYGSPVATGAAMNALRFMIALKMLDFNRFEAFPDPNGGVLLSSFHGDDSIEIFFRTDGMFDYAIERPGKEEEIGDNVDESAVVNKIWELSCQPTGNSSDSSNLFTIASRSEDLLASPSKTTMEGYLSWNRSAHVQQVAHYASISHGFTPIYPETLRYIGEYQPANFQRARGSTENVQPPGTTVTTLRLESQTAITNGGSAVNHWLISRSVHSTG
jgi:hypothetical protein